MSIVYRKHELYPESILIRDFVGKVDVHDIIDSWEFLFENKMISHKIKGVINNLSGCDLCLDMDSFKILIAYLKKQEFLKGVKLAVICNNPKTIIFPMLVENKESELKIKPFSTMEAAVSWAAFELD